MTSYVITLHRERILSQSKKAFSSNGDKKTRIRGKAGISFLPAKVVPCPDGSGKPCAIPDRDGKACMK